MPEEVLVSQETGDDAAVIRLPGDSGQALVLTADFFTPIVDDAYDWGRISAANAVSDVYAMGARPVAALNLVGWPVDALPLELLGRVLEGGQSIAGEAGFAVVGGHTIDDPEPKYGMAVIGFASEDRLLRNSTAPAGATLILTKPLGLGVVTTAIKRGRATDEQVRLAVETMTTLNRDAAEAALGAGAEAATDVTGFGLLGHLRSMLHASGVAAEVDASALDFLPGALDLAAHGVVPAGTRRNQRFLDDHVDWGSLPDAERVLLADAQTSGGLLIATTEPARMSAALDGRGVPHRVVGRTAPGPPGRISVTGRVRA